MDKFDNLPQIVVEAYKATGCKPARSRTHGDCVCAIGVLSKIHHQDDSYEWAWNFFGNKRDSNKFMFAFDSEEYARDYENDFFAQLGAATRKAVELEFGAF